MPSTSEVSQGYATCLPTLHVVVTLYDMFQESQKVDSEAVSRLVKLAVSVLRTCGCQIIALPPIASSTTRQLPQY